jgi:hypothetical protein
VHFNDFSFLFLHGFYINNVHLCFVGTSCGLKKKNNNNNNNIIIIIIINNNIIIPI